MTNFEDLTQLFEIEEDAENEDLQQDSEADADKDAISEEEILGQCFKEILFLH